MIADLDAQQHRRFIESHTPLDGLPYDEAVTYICVGRDLRDVAMSWADHSDNLDLEVLFIARSRAGGNQDLVAEAEFDTMRERADELAPDSSQGILQNNRTFFHSGRSGRWRDLIDDAGCRRYAERVAQLAPTDLIEWVHQELIGNLAIR